MDQAVVDTSRLFVELGCAIVGLAVLARVANRWGFSAIPLYLLAGEYGASVFSFVKMSLGDDARQVNVVKIDPEVAAAWSTRFKKLKECVEQKDTDRARKLLASKEF